MTQYSRNNNKKKKNTPTGKKPEKQILASSSIVHGLDTNILEEDLYKEFSTDKNNTYSTLLVNNTWVRFFDARSSFLKGMMALVGNSTTLRNVVNQKTSLTLGDGFIPIASDRVPFLQTLRKMFRLQKSDDEVIEVVNDLIGNVNLNNETLEEVIEKVAFDWWAFGNAMVELKKTKRDGEDVVLMYHIPLDQAGIKKANKNNIIEAIGVSSDWETGQTDPSCITEIPLYPNFDKDGRSAIHIKNYAPGFFYWGLPENIAARFWAEMEYRIPKYNITKFKNGFVPSAFIQLFGSMTPDEANKIVEDFEETFTDTGNNAKLLVQVLRDEKYKASVNLLEDKSDGNYMDLQKLASQAIVTANRWTMSLAGFATSGKLGSNQQIRDELEFVTNTTIKQGRRKIMQSIVNPFIKENAKVNDDIKGIMLHIANMNPISLASMLRPSDVLSKNEQREVFGYEPIEEDAPEPSSDDQGEGQN